MQIKHLIPIKRAEICANKWNYIDYLITISRGVLIDAITFLL